ncbi:MAG: RluA family pseudouridine synthase [Candidatus Rifleibacteriota bacterium]
MNNIHEWTVEENFAGTRLDAAISQKFKNKISRTKAQEMIKTGAITIEGQEVKANLKLKGGEKIAINFPEQEKEITVNATQLDFPILFEDDHMIVINKPSGLVVHPGAGREPHTVVSALLSHTSLSPIGAPVRPGVVQRLDKETSGVMVLAKTVQAHKALIKSFSSHKLDKEYLAIIQGHIVNKKGRIEAAIDRDKIHRKRMKITTPEKGRMAISSFEVLEYLDRTSFVRVAIETGRTHQIRVHMAFTGHPLLGDTTYGARKLEQNRHHFLHSYRLVVDHPVSGKELEFIAGLPERFISELQELGMSEKQLELYRE